MITDLKNLFDATKKFHEQVLKGNVGTLGDLNEIENAIYRAGKELEGRKKFTIVIEVLDDEGNTQIIREIKALERTPNEAEEAALVIALKGNLKGS